MIAHPVCATVSESDTCAVLARFAQVTERCGWIEVRLDAAPGLDLEAVVAARPRPLVVTCRPRREGGAYDGDDGERLRLLERAARLGAEAVDVEWDAADRLGELPPTCRVIVSRHRFEDTAPAEFEALLASVRHARATIQKLAVRVAGAEDALRLLAAARAEARPTLAIAMGFRGVVSRLAALRAGAPFTYAAADPERPAAPGQLSAARLAALLAGRALSAATSLYGVIGAPVSHSQSPQLMNAAFAALGEDAVYSWLETDDPLALLEAAWADPGLRGLSVTLPHKRACLSLPRVDADEAARAIGALNTLARTDTGWSGHNTDALAARALLEEALGPGARLALLGNGGAARAVAWAAKGLGAQVLLHARDEIRGRALAAELDLRWAGPLSAVSPSVDAVVNATSVGMTPRAGASPIDAALWHDGLVAYDLVYTPAETRFLREARAKGARTISGVEHFRRQARAQLELWLGAERLAGFAFPDA